MKIRSNYVSNSSSSSFVVAYDKDKIGDLRLFLKRNYIGCETYLDNEETFYKYYFDNDSERNDFKNLVQSKESEGKNIIFISLDNDYQIIIELFKILQEKDYGIELLYGECDS